LACSLSIAISQRLKRIYDSHKELNVNP